MGRVESILIFFEDIQFIYTHSRWKKNCQYKISSQKKDFFHVQVEKIMKRDKSISEVHFDI